MRKGVNETGYKWQQQWRAKGIPADKRERARERERAESMKNNNEKQTPTSDVKNKKTIWPRGEEEKKRREKNRKTHQIPQTTAQGTRNKLPKILKSPLKVRNELPINFKFVKARRACRTHKNK